MAKEVVVCSQEEAFELLDQLGYILDHDPLIDEVGYIHPSQLLVLNNEAESTSLFSDSQQADARMSSEPSTYDVAKGRNAFFWNRDHKLGISTAYLLPLYKAAKCKFMESLAIYRMHSIPSKTDNLPGSVAFSEVETEVMKHSRALLLMSSDFGTAWNARKLIISNREDFSSSDELLISDLVLSLAPKSENAWSHRRWVIKKIARRCGILEEILDKESKLVEKLAEALHELESTRNWAALHVADSSCFHYRRKLMMCMLGHVNEQNNEAALSSQFKSPRKLWKDELDWNEMLIRRYIGREALWLHRRFLSVGWVKHFGAIEHHPNDEDEVNNHVHVFMDYEQSLVQDCLNIQKSEFEDVQSQAIHAASYMLWLNREICSVSSIDLSPKQGATADLRALLNRLCPEKTAVWDHLTTNL